MGTDIDIILGMSLEIGLNCIILGLSLERIDIILGMSLELGLN